MGPRVLFKTLSNVSVESRESVRSARSDRTRSPRKGLTRMAQTPPSTTRGRGGVGTPPSAKRSPFSFLPVLKDWVLVRTKSKMWRDAVPALVTKVTEGLSLNDCSVGLVLPNRLALNFNFRTAKPFLELFDVALQDIRPYNGSDQAELRAVLLKAIRESCMAGAASRSLSVDDTSATAADRQEPPSANRATDLELRQAEEIEAAAEEVKSAAEDASLARIAEEEHEAALVAEDHDDPEMLEEEDQQEKADASIEESDRSIQAADTTPLSSVAIPAASSCEVGGESDDIDVSEATEKMPQEVDPSPAVDAEIERSAVAAVAASKQGTPDPRQAERPKKEEGPSGGGHKKTHAEFTKLVSKAFLAQGGAMELSRQEIAAAVGSAFTDQEVQEGLARLEAENKIFLSGELVFLLI